MTGFSAGVAGAAGAKFGGGLRDAARAHREGDPRAPMSRKAVRARAIGFVTINVILSSGLLALVVFGTPAWTAAGAVLGASIGVFWLLTSLLLLRAWSLRPAKRRLVSTAHIDGLPATIIRMSPHRLLEGTWVAAGFVVLCAGITAVAWIDGGIDSAIGFLLFFTGPLILIMLPVGIDMVAAAVRGASVILTPTGIEVRSWYSTAGMEWQELTGVRIATPVHGTRLLVDGDYLAPPPVKRRFTLWPWHERHRDSHLLIDLDAVEPHGVPLETLLHQAIRDPRTRARLGSSWAQGALEPRGATGS